MNFGKILTLALTNALALLLFAATLSSCYKSNVKEQSLYYKLSQEGPKRGLASINKERIKMSTKSISSYIFCKNNSLKYKKCIKDQLQLKNNNLIEMLDDKISEINHLLLKRHHHLISTYAQKLLNHCYDEKKDKQNNCVLFNTKSTAYKILGIMSKDYINDLNANETLYLKKVIHQELKKNLNVFKKVISKNKIDNFLLSIKEKKKTLKKELIKDLHWLSKIKNLSKAKEKCVFYTSQEFNLSSKDHIIAPYFYDVIEKQVCSDLISHKNVIEKINKNVNLHILSKISEMRYQLKRNYSKIKSSCKDDDECVNKKWESKISKATHQTYIHFQSEKISISKESIKAKINLIHKGDQTNTLH